MAIYYSSEYEDPQFKGIRVVVSIGSGIEQRYFGEDEEKEALAWEGVQLKKRDTYNRKMERVRPASKNQGFEYTKTGLSGLRINIKKCKGRAGQLYYRCVIALDIKSTVTGRKFSKAAIVTSQTLSAQWYKMCVLLAEHKGRSGVPKGWLDKCPNANDFNEVIEGYSKGKLFIDLGFSTLPRSKYPSAKSNVVKG